MDTYARSGTGSSIVASSRGGSSDLTPTERAAERNSGFPGTGRKERDPFRDDLRDLEKMLFEFESLSTKIVERQAYLFYAEEKRKKETASAPCEANCPLPASKSGFCDEHYAEWRSIGCDRSRFVLFCNATKNSEGLTLVTEL